MNADSYILLLIDKNPLLNGTEKLTVTPEKIKAMIRQAHAVGHAQGLLDAPKPSLFENIFGKKWIAPLIWP